MSSEIEIEDYEDRLGETATYDLGVMTRRQARRYARAVEDDNPLFHDVAVARERGYDDVVIPPNFLSAIIEPGAGVPAAELRPDGLPTGTIPATGFPLDLPRDAVMMGGGQDIEFDRYVTAGESITVAETFTDVSQKESARMGTLTFFETTADYHADDERVLRCDKTAIVANPQ